MIAPKNPAPAASSPDPSQHAPSQHEPLQHGHPQLGIGLDTGGTYTDAVLWDLKAQRLLRQVNSNPNVAADLWQLRSGSCAPSRQTHKANPRRTRALVRRETRTLNDRT